MRVPRAIEMGLMPVQGDTKLVFSVTADFLPLQCYAGVCGRLGGFSGDAKWPTGTGKPVSARSDFCTSSNLLKITAALVTLLAAWRGRKFEALTAR